MQSILSVKNLSKTYASGFSALQGIDLEIRRGEILALLGPNGAGKTTLISIVCGIVNASGGSVVVDGHDIVTDYRASRSLIGLVPQELTTDAFETVWATVSFSRGLFGKAANPAHIEKTLKALSLWDKKDARIRTLSGGMKRRVMIAKALSHEPQILFLDEPTAGVDVRAARGVRGLRRHGPGQGVPHGQRHPAHPVLLPRRRRFRAAAGCARPQTLQPAGDRIVPTHAEKRTLPYSPEQMYELVADVGKYPQFLPWCAGARVRTRTETELVADLTIGFGPFRESFTSRVQLDRPRKVVVQYENGPFRYLNNQWTFDQDPAGCRVSFFVDFEFRSRLLQSAIGVVFNEAVRRMVNAFLKRARDVYGAPSRQPADAPGAPA